MGRVAALLVLVLILSTTASAAPAPRLSGAKAVPACAGAGPYWPTQTLAVAGRTAWIACKEQSRILRVSLPSGRRLGATRLDGQPIAVLAANGAVWALDTSGTVARLDMRTARVTARIPTGASRPYNLWAGAGSLWTVDDASGEVVRLDPSRRTVTARIAVGDGPSDLVFSGTSAWVINHRDRGLVAIDTSTNRARRLATVPGDAPERIARAAGSLWVTGRGTDLLRLDPSTGAVRATIEIGAGGIDVVAASGSLWVPARAAAADRRGFPTMTALRRVDPGDNAISTPARARVRIDVHGLVPHGRGVAIADNTGGMLYLVPA
jgi:streptogramin lyase